MSDKRSVSRSIIMSLLTEEKERYSSYLQLCAHYQVNPDTMVTAASKAKIETLEQLLAGKPASKFIGMTKEQPYK